MNILEELKKLDKELKEIQYIKKIKNLPLHLQIEKILPFALKSGMENFKDIRIDDFYNNVCDFVILQNERQQRELKEKASLIFSEGNKNTEEFLFGENDYSGLSSEERIIVYRQKWDAIKNKDPIHHLAYSFSTDEVLGLFNINDNITRNEFEQFKNLYEVINIMNKDFIQNTVNNDTSGLDLFKKHASDIENTIRVSGIRDNFREKLNELLSNRFYKDTFFIPFQREQIRGDDFLNFTGVDLINSFVRELNSDYILRGEDLEKRRITLNSEHELIKEIPSISLKILNYRKKQYHGFINPDLGEPILTKFYKPTFNLLNSNEKNEIGDAIVLSLRMFRTLLPKAEYEIDKETGNYNLKMTVDDEFPIKKTYLNEKTDTVYEVRKEKFYSDSSNILLFSHGYKSTEKTKNLIDNFYSSINETNDADSITNFYNFDKFKSVFLEKAKLNELSSSSNLLSFISIEVDKIKQIHKNEYNFEEKNIQATTTFNTTEKNTSNPETENISSLTSLKNKLTNLFKSNDVKEKTLKK